MSYTYRIKCRIDEEGFLQTLKYAMAVFCRSLQDHLCDTVLDLRYSHKFLKGNLKKSYKDLGANDVYHTKYSAMPVIFNQVSLSKDDVLVDVGCGKGRVINKQIP
jgi:hypothetical protein